MLANLRISGSACRAAALFEEVPQGAGVGGHEDLGLGGVGQHAAGGLAGGLAAGGAVRLVLAVRSVSEFARTAST